MSARQQEQEENKDKEQQKPIWDTVFHNVVVNKEDEEEQGILELTPGIITPGGPDVNSFAGMKSLMKKAKQGGG